MENEVSVILSVCFFSKHPTKHNIHHLCDMSFRVTELAGDSSVAANVLSLNSMVVSIQASAVRVESFAA